MLKHYPADTLGQGDHGWLKTRYHFSFADYHNPKRMHFGKLRVINDDVVQAGHGFDMHPHRDMEIITFVRSGAITHKDSEGHAGRTEAGNVQVMSAGTGIYHAEFNDEDEDTTLYQIWIYPKEKGIAPRWDTAQFSNRVIGNREIPLLVSGRVADADKGALYIHQNASIRGGVLPKGQSVTQAIEDQAYILVSAGVVTVGDVVLHKGDGLEVTEETSVTLSAEQEAEIVFLDIPA